MLVWDGDGSIVLITSLSRQFGLNSGCSDADLGTPCMQSAPSEENLDFTPNGECCLRF